MSNIDYTVDGIIADVKRQGAIPTHQSLFDESDFVNVLSDDMKTVLVPLIMSTMENHFQDYKETAIVAGTQSYSTPWRAIGNKLKDVEIWDGASKLLSLPRLDLRDISGHSVGNPVGLFGFRMESSNVVLVPDDNWAGKTLRLYYFRRPNDLCPTDEAGKVVTITPPGDVLLNNVPTDWTTSDTFDAIAAVPPFKARGEELAISAINSLTLTFSALPATLAVGDWICLKGQSTIPQIPYDAFPLLSARGVCAVMAAISPQAAAQAEQGYGNLHKMFMSLIAPRVDDAPKKLVSRKGIWQARGIPRWPS